MQRHLSTGATIIAALLAADRPSTGSDMEACPRGPDARSLLAELGWGAHYSVAHRARTLGRDPREAVAGAATG